MYHSKSCCVVRGIQHFQDKNFKRIGVHGWASLIKEIRGRACQNDSSARAKFTTRLSRPVPCPPTLFICGRRARAACHMPIFPRKKVQIKHVCAKLLARSSFCKQIVRRHGTRRSPAAFSTEHEGKNVYAQFVTLQFEVPNNKDSGFLSPLMESNGGQCSVSFIGCRIIRV